MSFSRTASNSKNDEVAQPWERWEQDLSDVHYQCINIRKNLLYLFDLKTVRVQSAAYRVLVASLEINMKYSGAKYLEGLGKNLMPPRMKPDQDYIYMAWEEYAELCEQGQKLYDEYSARKGPYHILRPQVDLIKRRIEILQKDLIWYGSLLKEAKVSFSRDAPPSRLFDSSIGDSQTGHGSSSLDSTNDEVQPIRAVSSRGTQTDDLSTAGDDRGSGPSESKKSSPAGREQRDSKASVGCGICLRVRSEMPSITGEKAAFPDTSDSPSNDSGTGRDIPVPVSVQDFLSSQTNAIRKLPPSFPPPKTLNSASVREVRPVRTSSVVSINSDAESTGGGRRDRCPTSISIDSDGHASTSLRRDWPLRPIRLNSYYLPSSVITKDIDAYSPKTVRQDETPTPVSISSKDGFLKSPVGNHPWRPIRLDSFEKPPTMITIDSDNGNDSPVVQQDKTPTPISFSSNGSTLVSVEQYTIPGPASLNPDGKGSFTAFQSNVPVSPQAWKAFGGTRSIPWKPKATTTIIENPALTPPFDGDFDTHVFTIKSANVPVPSSYQVNQENLVRTSQHASFNKLQTQPETQNSRSKPPPCINPPPLTIYSEPTDAVARMLQNMGYTPGTGLGPYGNGIISPVKAVGYGLGDARTGLGYNESPNLLSDNDIVLERIISRGRIAKLKGTLRRQNKTTLQPPNRSGIGNSYAGHSFLDPQSNNDTALDVIISQGTKTSDKVNASARPRRHVKNVKFETSNARMNNNATSANTNIDMYSRKNTRNNITGNRTNNYNAGTANTNGINIGNQHDKYENDTNESNKSSNKTNGGDNSKRYTNTYADTQNTSNGRSGRYRKRNR